MLIYLLIHTCVKINIDYIRPEGRNVARREAEDNTQFSKRLFFTLGN